MVNVAEIARDADINQTQAKDWLGILETLGIIFYLHPYSNNLLKRLVKTPKLYFYDTGLVCYLTKWSSAETLESGAMNGTILENYVVAEIRKTYLNCGKEPYMYYYRDKDAKEIDIVLEHDGVLNPIEIKKTSNPGTELIKVLGAYKNSAFCSIFVSFSEYVVKNVQNAQKKSRRNYLNVILLYSAMLTIGM